MEQTENTNQQQETIQQRKRLHIQVDRVISCGIIVILVVILIFLVFAKKSDTNDISAESLKVKISKSDGTVEELNSDNIKIDGDTVTITEQSEEAEETNTIPLGNTGIAIKVPDDIYVARYTFYACDEEYENNEDCSTSSFSAVAINKNDLTEYGYGSSRFLYRNWQVGDDLFNDMSLGDIMIMKNDAWPSVDCSESTTDCTGDNSPIKVGDYAIGLYDSDIDELKDSRLNAKELKSLERAYNTTQEWLKNKDNYIVLE